MYSFSCYEKISKNVSFPFFLLFIIFIHLLYINHLRICLHPKQKWVFLRTADIPSLLVVYAPRVWTISAAAFWRSHVASTACSRPDSQLFHFVCLGGESFRVPPWISSDRLDIASVIRSGMSRISNRWQRRAAVTGDEIIHPFCRRDGFV